MTHKNICSIIQIPDSTGYFLFMQYSMRISGGAYMGIAELYEKLTDENKIKFENYLAMLIETQDNCQPLPGSQE